MSSTQDYEQRNIKCISRMDFGSTHGWFVRIYHRGVTHRKLFSDSIFGSQEAALQAATTYRDDYLRKHHIEDLPATGFAPGVVTALDVQPAEKVYFDLAGGTHLASGASLGSASQGASHLTSDFSLSIPKLGLEMPIVGVPLVNGKWDVSWLGEQAGYLEGKACQLPSSGATCKDGPIKVVAAAGTVTSDQACQIIIKEKSSGYFELDGRVFDVKVICNGQEKTSFDPPLKVCILPTTAQLDAAGFSYANMVMYHNHGGVWTGYTSLQAFGENGYLCMLTDKLSEFTIRVLEAPATGFAPGVVTALDVQPAEKVYFDLAGGTHLSSGASLGSASQGASHLTSDFYLSIPKLGLEMPIVGVPLTLDGWDVTWLGEQAGYLEGTAFPTWAGNTAITAHVWNADNTPGPLHMLKHGDEIVIHAWGQDHIYEVRATRQVGPKDLSLMEHSDYDVLTLITCKDFNLASGKYDWRLAVRAVLIIVETE